jgi:hypothetical protein
MSASFRPTTPDDRPRLAAMLSDVFGSPQDSSLLAPNVMAWKYWEPRGDWPDPRSFVIERDGAFTAHVAIWPADFGPSGPHGVHMIDWGAARGSPGAGMTLVERLARKYDFILAIGGAEMTRKVLPAYGFKEVARTWTAARPLRPLAQALSHQSRNWKLAVRTARNWWWSRTPAAPALAGWTAAPVEPARLSTGLAPQFFPRPAAFFEYLLRCPAGGFRLYSLARGGQPEGHFLLSLVRGQARLAGLWLRQASEDQYRAGVLLAQRAAHAIADACEFAAKGTEGASRRAALAAGLRPIDSAPVFLLDRKDVFPKADEFQFQFIDDDGAFLDIGRTDYLT